MEWYQTNSDRLVWMMATLVLIAVSFFPVRAAFAHCDGLDGPVVKTAQEALQSGELTPVLIWVRPQDEEEIKRAFEETLAVRKLSPEAQAFADRYFFEALVRIHRAGENAPYTGLKPAGRDLGPAIPAADKALEIGSDETVAELLTDEVREGLHHHFKDAVKRNHLQQTRWLPVVSLSRLMWPTFTTWSAYTKQRRNSQAGITLKLIEDCRGGAHFEALKRRDVTSLSMLQL